MTVWYLDGLAARIQPRRRYYQHGELEHGVGMARVKAPAPGTHLVLWSLGATAPGSTWRVSGDCSVVSVGKVFAGRRWNNYPTDAPVVLVWGPCILQWTSCRWLREPERLRAKFDGADWCLEPWRPRPCGFMGDDPRQLGLVLS